MERDKGRGEEQEWMEGRKHLAFWRSGERGVEGLGDGVGGDDDVRRG